MRTAQADASEMVDEYRQRCQTITRIARYLCCMAGPSGEADFQRGRLMLDALEYVQQGDGQALATMEQRLHDVAERVVIELMGSEAWRDLVTPTDGGNG